MKFSRATALLAKLEVTPGVDAVPTAAANGVMAFNVKLTPMEGQEASRRVTRPYYTADQKFPTGLHQKLMFETELVGHATRGTAPAWSPIARAGGLAEFVSAGVSVAYNPIYPVTASATMWFYMDGILHKLTSCRGAGKLKLNVNGLPMIEWEFMGLYADPTDAALVNPALALFQDPQVADSLNTTAFTINGFACAMSKFELDIGNKTKFRERAANIRSVEIMDRVPAITTTVEVEALASFNPFTLARAQTAFAVNLVHGVGNGDIVTINAPNCRMNRPTGYEDDDGLTMFPLSITPLPTAGNDDFTITLT